jgi:hypothetical protein
MVAAVLEVRATEKRKVETESLDESRAFIELEREAAHRARRFSSGARIGAACSEKPNVPTVPTEV